MPVTVEGVRFIEKPSTIAVEGIIQAVEEKIIKCESDCKLAKIFVKKGANINRDDLIAQLSEEDVNYQIDLAKAKIRESEALLEKNEYYLRNRERLLEDGTIEQDQFDNLETEVSGNKTTLKEQQARLSSLEKQLDNLFIRSPMSGSVIEVFATPGTEIKKDGPIVSIATTDPMVCKFDVPAEAANEINLGNLLKINIEGSNEPQIKGEVSYIATAASKESKTVEVTATIPNYQNRLKPGSKLTAELTTGSTKKSSTIPASAIISEQGKIFVFTVVSGVAHKTPIKFLRKFGNLAEVESGLTEDDIIVVKGNEKLKEGTKVDIWSGK